MRKRFIALIFEILINNDNNLFSNGKWNRGWKYADGNEKSRDVQYYINI